MSLKKVSARALFCKSFCHSSIRISARCQARLCPNEGGREKEREREKVSGNMMASRPLLRPSVSPKCCAASAEIGIGRGAKGQASKGGSRRTVARGCVGRRERERKFEVESVTVKPVFRKQSYHQSGREGRESERREEEGKQQGTFKVLFVSEAGIARAVLAQSLFSETSKALGLEKHVRSEARVSFSLLVWRLSLSHHTNHFLVNIYC